MSGLHESLTLQLSSLAPDKAYAQALSEGYFLIQQCSSCKKHIFFPRVICIHCTSDDLLWVRPSGLGTVYSVTTVRRREDSGGPYNVSIIRLDEGVQLMSRVVDLAPEQVQIGMRVAAFVDCGGDKPILYFRQAGEA